MTLFELDDVIVLNMGVAILSQKRLQERGALAKAAQRGEMVGAGLVLVAVNNRFVARAEYL